MIEERVIFSRWNRNPNTGKNWVNERTGEEEESRTKQSEADACDINNIMKRYARTGQIEHQTLRPPQYGDFSSTLDFQAVRNRIAEAEGAFSHLSADVRKRFGNDAANLVDFMSDDANIEEGKQLGLYHEDEPDVVGDSPVVDVPPVVPASGDVTPE